MNIEYFQRTKIVLIECMKELRLSIDDATEKFIQLYGENHEIVERLKSYYPALDQQEKCAEELDSLINAGDFEELNHVSLKIKAISEMIKNDAKELLASIQNGKNILPDDITYH